MFEMLFGMWVALAAVLVSAVVGAIVIVARPRIRARRYQKINDAIDGYAARYRWMSPRARDLYRIDLIIYTYGFFRNQDAINRAHAALRVLNEERIKG